MQTIELPGNNLAQLDLNAINAQLREGSAQLDWSLVEEVSDAELTQLLGGLNLSDHGAALGEDTLSPQLANRIIAILQQNPDPDPETAPLLQTTDQFDLRKRLVEMIYKDLHGPVNGEFEEVDESSLTERYLIGAIAPRHRNKQAEDPTEEDPAQQDPLAATGQKTNDDGDTEENAPNSSLFPSSLGMTFSIAGDSQNIQIIARWGSYDKGKSNEYLTQEGNPKSVWQRTPHSDRKTFALREDRTTPLEWQPDPNSPDVVVKLRYRRYEENWLVTVFLENLQTEPRQNREKSWIFQPEITVQHPDKRPIFIRKPLNSNSKLDVKIRAEQESLQLLYRNSVEFAVGHNTSIHADLDPQNPQQAYKLRTSLIPRCLVPSTAPPDAREIPALAGLELDMKALATAPPETLPRMLTPLTRAYEEWLEEQEQNIPNLPQEPDFFQKTARRNLENCRQALERIQGGIDLLTRDSQALQAFQFMNQAMTYQRIRGIYAEQKRQGHSDLAPEALDQPKNHSWRTFQLAFILLNLPGLTDLNHSDRRIGGNCDLLWFPTGGGKTEAYLGLTAYTLALRRLQGVVNGYDGNYGVAVLMRYTLRLLTLQQFQRATTLICACEAIRRKNPELWGQEPFRIGLWVGNKSTPNWTRQSEEVIKQERGQNYSGNIGTPHQLTNCPWCGSEINPGKHIDVRTFEKDMGRTLVFCGDLRGQCLFSRRQAPDEGLPVVVVDEEIYRRLPALVIATVDKFAQMPWNGKTQMLFGKVNGYCPRHGFRCPDLEDSDFHPAKGKLPAARTRAQLPLRPPDLIIQDELHLISGPLGSLVGLYETAVDELCTWDAGNGEGGTSRPNGNPQKVRPKVIASTATIRQANSQVHNLFLRKVKIFPPQAIDIEDNFFSRQRPPSAEHPGRLYLGICAPGRRIKAAVIRVYLAALAAGQQLLEEGHDADPWMTLVGYFNSLRELGGTRRLVDDDITTRLFKMDQRGLAKRSLRKVEELTSRKSSTDIPKILDALECKFERQEARGKRPEGIIPNSPTPDSGKSADSRLPTPKGDKKRNKGANYPLDVILATNMISVGVDVKRLGLMVACGQPKNTAEYIQATSRVGRNSPGLVLTIYNWARPRDLSHYERFEHYHKTFYQHVEPLSVTPASSGALQRGLAALLVSLVRLSGFEFNGQNGAAKLTEEMSQHSDVVNSVDAIANRIVEIFQDASKEPEIRERLRGLIEAWKDRAQPDEAGSKLQYRASQGGGTTISLLHDRK
ncbi:DISARM system helicase DrmA [Spirulina subsalsa FACHB-351]|uniref:DISARM system helicase DrmA n=1 Tax=Spirulina subsalsa FACHB-351 TaxID=234711 RepID=A0ABT3LBL9_9CYAN|nr:DISARM system helicase DrmA [Spirulina subsalsa]MCW6038909.1 DISARM system helicase DrmA [Spirulina subsalsa FACHB-351]